MTKQEAIELLRKELEPGDKVYCILRHVSKSGMTRVIDLVIGPDNRHIGYWAAIAMEDRYDDKKQGIRIGGCGMDMGFALVYNLGRVLFPDGFAPSNIAIRPCDAKSVNVNIGRGKMPGH